MDRAPALVVENLKRLDACPGPHDFEFIRHRGADGVGPKRTRWRCTVCGGEVPGTARHWYVRGLTDARRVAEDRP